MVAERDRCLVAIMRARAACLAVGGGEPSQGG
jgi:hypothetical protein